jgi:UDPglucose 6-dehydrogenase
MLLKRFPGTPILQMTSDESEAVKLFQNSIFAVTVSLWNELRSLSDKLELDWDSVRNGILSDGRISSSHTQVPGRDGYGFGSKCLPKDLANLIQEFNDNDVISTILKAAQKRNDAIDLSKRVEGGRDITTIQWEQLGGHGID